MTDRIWPIWQQWAAGILATALLAIGSGMYVRMEARVMLLEDRQLRLLEDIATLKQEFISEHIYDTQVQSTLLRLQTQMDGLLTDARRR